MTAILLSILKITGIVLLSIIALILLAIILVLFVPIRYRIKGKKNDPADDISAKATVSFLLHIIHACVFYENDIGYCIRVFGIKIRPRKNKEIVVNEESSHIEEITPSDDASADTLPEEDYTIDWNDIHAPDPGSEVPDDITDEADDDDDEYESLSERIAKIIDKIIGKYEGLKDKYDHFRREYRFWDKMIKDERNREAAGLIKTTVTRLIRRILPKRIKGYVHFGFEDPATTGKVLSYLAIFYPILPRKLEIDPGFNDTDIYGNIDAKGHIALIFPTVYFLKLYFNKDIKRMRRIYARHKESQ